MAPGFDQPCCAGEEEEDEEEEAAAEEEEDMERKWRRASHRELVLNNWRRSARWAVSLEVSL